MTVTTDITADATHDEDVPEPEAAGGYDPTAEPTATRAMIAIELLTAHPGNVRRDIHLDEEFLASIAELGILTPLRITPAGGGVYRVIDGYVLPVTVRLHVEHVTWQETSSLFT